MAPNERLLVALDEVLAGTKTAALGAAAERLSGVYRTNTVPATPILATSIDVCAYAAYRMPATFAAVRSALRQAQQALPGFTPATIVDLGAGTGAASWAVAEVYAPQSFIMLEQAVVAMAVGRDLAARSSCPTLQRADWRRWHATRCAPSIPAADLVVAAYVLAELAPAAQNSLVDVAAAGGRAVLIVEPGTPTGHARVLVARERLMAAGFSIAAPCPHECECPLLRRDGDWCHFAARITRSDRHRRLKDAYLNYEDEKFSFVMATRNDPITPAARIIRRPLKRKGFVSLELCVANGEARQHTVTKRNTDLYRAARKAEWGDRWLLGAG
ncbi:MAG: small ribosomal subunit Rsm22 family protein [Streptosporangiaceae bacterium]